MNMKKVLAMMLAVVLIVTATVAGTVAWLTDKTDSVVNTFTESDVDISLSETTGNSYKMVPGATIDKDPVATVVAGSEACYLFVEISETGGYTVGETTYTFDDFMTYAIAAGWNLLGGTPGAAIDTAEEDAYVIYRTVSASDADQPFDVLAGTVDSGKMVNQITVKDTVTKAMMDGLTSDNYPKLTFTAYAIQQEGFATAALAWDEVRN